MPTKFIQDEEVNWDITFYSDRAKTTKVDPTSVQFLLEGPDGIAVPVTPAANGARPANLGKYRATSILDKYGTWTWRWITGTPRIVSQGVTVVEQDVTEA